MTHIHTEIKKLRQLNDWTQNEMAEILKVSQAYYSKIERGERIPTQDILKKLTKIYHLKDDHFENFATDSQTYNEETSKKIKKTISDTEKIRIIRDTLSLYSTYANEAIRVLPEELKELNANLSAILILSKTIPETIKNSKIRNAIDLEHLFDDYFDESKDLPDFDTYITNKTKILNDLLQYKKAFARIYDDLNFFSTVLKKVELGLSLNSNIKNL